LLIWIEGSLSPQEMRDRVLSDDNFQKALIEWLEFCHTGDYFTSTEDLLQESWEKAGDEYISNGRIQRTKPTLLIPDVAMTLPVRPPDGMSPSQLQEWYKVFRADVDRVVFCSNRHDPDHKRGCMRGQSPNKYCRARFPRETFDDTMVDSTTGAIRFQKKAKMINSYNPLISGALRCNTDFTSLMSGTSIRAIIAYVTDYITKNGLTTHTFFQTIRTV
ncbi:hypothetical protein C2E23DRAFT_701816, partial [Lenzites betulinus]